MPDERMMRAALEQARLALAENEIPVGCVVEKGGEIIARGHNLREISKDPTQHAEIVAIRGAAEVLGDWRLFGCTLYVTLEPCPMCAGAIAMSRISRVVFGAYDEKMGCCGSYYRLTEDPAFMNFAPATGGVLERECKALISAFFENRRHGE